jgi:hypothetical protein
MQKRGISLLGGILLFCWLGATLSCDCLCGEKVAATPPPPLHVPAKPAPIEPGKPWQFAVSGDSRNCGDVVMPAIAQGADHDHAQFYWHLGDLRAIYDFDEDFVQAAKLNGQHMTIAGYEQLAWRDFRQYQTIPFGGIPFFLGIGNHETVANLKTREEFTHEFADFLDLPELRQQRQKDAGKGAAGPPKTYFHWVMADVDFIYLDNATPDQFDADQMKWALERIDSDKQNDSVHTVVVGMHEALPNSISSSHSMNQMLDGGKSGIQIYQDLLELRKKKKVYVLASHSHYYMEDIYNTQFWQSNGGVLPGWIVGTAGAHRYRLPEPNTAKVAKTNVYGYLLGTVNPTEQDAGAVKFEFKQLDEKNVPPAIVQAYSQEFVHWCFVENTDVPSSIRGTNKHETASGHIENLVASGGRCSKGLAKKTNLTAPNVDEKSSVDVGRSVVYVYH